MTDKEKFEKILKEASDAWSSYYHADGGNDDFYEYGWKCVNILDKITEMYDAGKIKFESN